MVGGDAKEAGGNRLGLDHLCAGEEVVMPDRGEGCVSIGFQA